MLPQIALLFPIFSLMLLSLFSVSSADSNVYVKCSQQYFTPATPYDSNLNSLFTSLVDASSVSNFNKFEISTTTPGDSTTGDSTAYGLFQCRGDINSSNCRDCVMSSISQLKTACPVSAGGTIQLDGCFVKYDDTSFFGAENKMEVLKKCGPSIGHNSDLQKRIDDALAYLTSGNGNYFRQGNFGSIAGVAQCVQDLNVTDCEDCLSEACALLRSECDQTSSWANMFLGTCYIQYVDTGDGNNDTNDGPNNNRHGRRSNKRKFSSIWSTFGPFVTSAASFIGSYYNTREVNKKTIKKTKNKYRKVTTTVSGVQRELEDARNDLKNAKKRVDNLEEEVDAIKKNITRRPPSPPSTPPPPSNPCQQCYWC